MTYLVRVDPSRRMDRWYSIIIQPTLFDRWAVICAWGSRRNNYQRQRAIPANNTEEAEELATQIIAKKKRKGYIERTGKEK